MAGQLKILNGAVVAALLFAGSVGTSSAARDVLPVFDLRKTCADAREFGSPSERDIAYQGCLQDEKNARATLLKKWASYKPADKRACVVEGPDPSYVEMLTCLGLASFPDQQ